MPMFRTGHRESAQAPGEDRRTPLREDSGSYYSHILQGAPEIRIDIPPSDFVEYSRTKQLEPSFTEAQGGDADAPGDELERETGQPQFPYGPASYLGGKVTGTAYDAYPAEREHSKPSSIRVERRKRQRSSEVVDSDTEEQPDSKRLKAGQDPQPDPHACPFPIQGRGFLTNVSCHTKHHYFSHLCKHLERDHGFKRGPTKAKRYLWLALFDVDNDQAPENGPVLCLGCLQDFQGRAAWKKHEAHRCVRSKMSFAKSRAAVKSTFFDDVFNDSRFSGAKDITRIVASLKHVESIIWSLNNTIDETPGLWFVLSHEALVDAATTAKEIGDSISEIARNRKRGFHVYKGI